MFCLPSFCFFQSCSLYPSWLPIYLPLGSTSATDQHCTLCSQALGALGLSSLIDYCTNFAPDIQEPHLASALSTFSLPVPAENPLGTPSITAFPDLQQKSSCVTDQGSWTRSIEFGKWPDTSSGEKSFIGTHEGAKTSNMFPC